MRLPPAFVASPTNTAQIIKAKVEDAPAIAPDT
jgi:hypothetical protein